MSSHVGTASKPLLHASTLATAPSIFHVGVTSTLVAAASVSSGAASSNLMTVSFFAEGEDADAGSEVAVDRLDAELVLSVSQREPLLSGQLDRFLLSQRRLIAADLHIVHELGDDHVVALDVAHGVVLR